MNAGSLLPDILKGGIGVVATLLLVIYSLWRGWGVLRSEHQLALQQIEDLKVQNKKLVEANDSLIKTAEDERSQKGQLIANNQLGNQMLAAIILLAGGKPPPVPAITAPILTTPES